MANTEIRVDFTPSKLKAYAKNEVVATISVKNMSDVNTYWCECEVKAMPPLSLAHDSELTTGRIRIGILKPKDTIRKQAKVYTRPNNYPDEYKMSVISFIYDGDGAISERNEHSEHITCVEETARNIQDNTG